MKTWTEHYGQESREGLMSREFWLVKFETRTTIVEFWFENCPDHVFRNIYVFEDNRHRLTGVGIEGMSGENAKNLRIALGWANRERENNKKKKK